MGRGSLFPVHTRQSLSIRPFGKVFPRYRCCRFRLRSQSFVESSVLRSRAASTTQGKRPAAFAGQFESSLSPSPFFPTFGRLVFQPARCGQRSCLRDECFEQYLQGCLVRGILSSRPPPILLLPP